MSLRKGHIRSRIWAPPTLRDDWRDDAACTGMMTTEVPVETCAACPAREQCGLLYDEVNDVMQSGRKQDRAPMPGTWGGVDHTEAQRIKAEAGRFKKTRNFGPCKVDGCETQARAMLMCNKHYLRTRDR